MTLTSAVKTSGLVFLLVVLFVASLRHHYQVQALVQQLQQATREDTATSSPSRLEDDGIPVSFWAFLRQPLLISVPPLFVVPDRGYLLSTVASYCWVFSHAWASVASPLVSGTWGTVATVALGFFLGILFSETPLVDPVLRFFGLANSGRFGTDILEGTAWTYSGGGHWQPAGAGKQPQRTNSGMEDNDGNDEQGEQHATIASGLTSSMSGITKERMKQLSSQRLYYGLKYSFLNVEVTGGWLGMGLWPKDGSKIPYREACQAMVRKVTTGLKIDASSHILDVGFGCGDQTVYMAELYQPSRITGITIEPLQHYAGQQLVLNCRDRIPNTQVDLFVADACKLPEFLKEHPGVLGSSLSAEEVGQQPQQYFTHIVSIDSAYHFNTRRQFFEHAYKTLTPGKGRLALADIVPSRVPPTKGLRGWIFSLFSRYYLKVPMENMKTLEGYRQDLVDAGFVDIEIEAVEDQVFVGWADFIATQLKVMKSVGLVRPRVGWSFWWLQRVLRAVDRKKTMQFIVVKATRGE